MEYGAHLVPEGGLHSMPVQYPVTAGCWWAMRCAVASIPEFRARHGYGADWRAGGGTNADSACQHREPQNLFPLYHHNVEAACCGMFYSVISMFRRFCNAGMVPYVACVNAGYFPRFMG